MEGILLKKELVELRRRTLLLGTTKHINNLAAAEFYLPHFGMQSPPINLVSHRAYNSPHL